MTRGWRWTTSVVGVLVALVVAVWAFGGFRETSDTLPRAAVGERVDLGRYAITVTGAHLTDTDEDGKPLKDFDQKPLTVLVVSTRVEMLDVEAGRPPFGSEPAVRVQDGRSPWDSLPRADGDPLHDAVQPGVPKEQDIWFVAPARTPTAVRVVLGTQDYDWTNMINSGPDWSSVAVPAVTVADVAVEDRTRS